MTTFELEDRTPVLELCARVRDGEVLGYRLRLMRASGAVAALVWTETSDEAYDCADVWEITGRVPRGWGAIVCGEPRDEREYVCPDCARPVEFVDDRWQHVDPRAECFLHRARA